MGLSYVVVNNTKGQYSTWSGNATHRRPQTPGQRKGEYCSERSQIEGSQDLQYMWRPGQSAPPSMFCLRQRVKHSQSRKSCTHWPDCGTYARGPRETSRNSAAQCPGPACLEEF